MSPGDDGGAGAADAPENNRGDPNQSDGVVNDPLLVEPCTLANRNPPSPASPAETAKAQSLAVGTEMPEEAAAGSEARTANGLPAGGQPEAPDTEGDQHDA